MAQVAEQVEMSKKDVEKLVNVLFGTIEETLREGEKVQLVGFGTFEVRDRKARKGRNPQTGDEIEIPATRVLPLRRAKPLKMQLYK